MATNFEMTKDQVLHVARRSLEKYRMEYNLLYLVDGIDAPLSMFREMYEIATLLQDALINAQSELSLAKGMIDVLNKGLSDAVDENATLRKGAVDVDATLNAR